MPFNPFRFTDHWAYTDLTLNTNFTLGALSVNNIATSDIPDGAFRAEHLPSLVVQSAGSTIDDVALNPTPHYYVCRKLTLAAHLPPPVTNYSYAPYRDFANSTLADWATSSPGWAFIQTTTEDLVATFGAPVDLSDTTISGILVLANTQVGKIAQTFDQGVANFSSDVWGMWAIMFNNNGTWRTIARTERYRCGDVDEDDPDPSKYTTVADDVSIRTFITLSDLPIANKTISAVAMVCAVFHPDCLGLGHHSLCLADQEDDDYAYVQLYRGNITALALQASV